MFAGVILYKEAEYEGDVSTWTAKVVRVGGGERDWIFAGGGYAQNQVVYVATVASSPEEAFSQAVAWGEKHLKGNH